MPTQAERIARLEAIQKIQEEEDERVMAAFSERIDKAQEVAQKALSVATEANNSIEGMPAKVIEAIRMADKGKRLEVKDWFLFSFSALAALALVADKLGLFKG